GGGALHLVPRAVPVVAPTPGLRACRGPNRTARGAICRERSSWQIAEQAGASGRTSRSEPEPPLPPRGTVRYAHGAPRRERFGFALSRAPASSCMVASMSEQRLGRDVFLALAAVGWADGKLDEEEADAIVRTALEEGLELD